MREAAGKVQETGVQDCPLGRNMNWEQYSLLCGGVSGLEGAKIPRPV